MRFPDHPEFPYFSQPGAVQTAHGTPEIQDCDPHQDPRYFRRGTGNGWSRLGYAAGQVFWTHNDSGRGQLNFSEIAGNSTAVAISMAYYPENRDVADGVSKLGGLGVDMASNILERVLARSRTEIFA